MLIPFTMLAIEASGVMALRIMNLISGDSDSLNEAELMAREKIDAAIEAAASLIAGASGDEIIHRYRQHVAANAKRLEKSRSEWSRKSGYRT